MIKAKDPIIVFMMKTKSNKDWIMIVHDQHGYKNGVVVSRVKVEV